MPTTFSEYSAASMPSRPLSRAEKATAILLAMGKPVAGKLLKFFEQSELQTIIARAQSLRSVAPDELEKIVAEFEELFTEGAGLMDNAKAMEGILEEGLTPDEVDGLLGRRIAPPTQQMSVWERVERADPDVLWSFLSKESPQMAAFVFSRLPSAVASRLVMQMPAERRADTVHRALNMKRVNPRVAAIIEQRLGEFLSERESESAAGGSDKVVEVMNELAKPQVEELLGQLETVSPADAARVRPKIFLFDDIVAMPLKSRVTLFNDLSSEVITMALKGADDAVKEAALSSIGARQRRMIESELGGETPGGARDIAVARRSITQEAIRLAATGTITLREAGAAPAAAA